MRQGGGSLLLWGCMSAGEVGNLNFINGIMDQHVYPNILRDQSRENVWKLKFKRKATFQ